VGICLASSMQRLAVRTVKMGDFMFRGTGR
jgi:hypothetical protein